MVARIDWQGLVSFVFCKTIPYFWIPAHTIPGLGEENPLINYDRSLVAGRPPVKAMKLTNIDWEEVIKSNVKASAVDVNLLALKNGMNVEWPQG